VENLENQTCGFFIGSLYDGPLMNEVWFQLVRFYLGFALHLTASNILSAKKIVQKKGERACALLLISNSLFVCKQLLEGRRRTNWVAKGITQTAEIITYNRR